MTENPQMKKRELLIALQEKYRETFGTPYGKEVLKDLLLFCRFDARDCLNNTNNIDPLKQAIHVGRADVAQRIQTFLDTDLSVLFSIYNVNDN